MPFIPYDTQTNIEEQKQPEQNIFSTLFPRSSKVVGNLANTGVDITSQLGSIFQGQFGTPEQKQQAGKSFTEAQQRIEGRKKELGYEGINPTLKTIDQAVGVAGEVAPFFFGVPEAGAIPKGANILSKVINKAVPFTKLGFGTGVTHGITTPETSLEERGIKGVNEGIGGAATGTTLGLVSQLLKPVFDVIKGSGKGIFRRVIQPEVGEGPGWSTRAERSTETLLNKTKITDITPARLDKSITKSLTDTTQVIKSHLKNIPEEFDMSKIEKIIDDDLSKKVPSYMSKTTSRSISSNLGEETSTLKNFLDERSTHLSTGGSSIDASKIYEAKEAVGNYLKEPGNVFYKMARNQPLDRIDRLQLSFYNSVKDMINNISKQYSKSGLDISSLSEMESRLFQASAGVQSLGEKPLSKISPFGWEKLPILSSILSMLESAELGVGRGLYETGKLGQKVTEEAVPNIIKTIIAGRATQNK